MKQIQIERNEKGQFTNGTVSWNTGIQVPQVQEEKHPAWKGGNHGTARRMLKRRGIDLTYCRICKDDKRKIIIHHIDGNEFNNDLFNLGIICTYCHNAIHDTPSRKKNRFQKGHIVTKETREKISKANKGNSNIGKSTQFKKGNKAHLGHFKNKLMEVTI